MEKVVVITGGTSGIGQNLKHRFENDGDIVYALSLSNKSNEKNFIECDVSKSDMVKNAIEKVIDEQGRIDILINNAGYGLFGATELIDCDSLQKQIDVNFMGVVFVTKFALPYMSKGAKIVNIASTCAMFPLPYRSMYSASKAAVDVFSQSMKIELKQLGIDVTSICPGDIKTTFIQNRVKNFDTNERYNDRIQRASQTVESKNDKRMDIDFACKKIYKIILKKHYKPQYIIGTKYKFLNFATKLFPKQLYSNIVEKHFGGN